MLLFIARLLMPTVPPLEALKIQVRAVTADDNCLAQAALDRGAQDHFPSESSYPILEQMRTRDLLRLVSTPRRFDAWCAY